MKIVKRFFAYSGKTEDHELFEPGDIVVAETSPNSIQIVKSVVVDEKRSPFSDKLKMETLWRFDGDFSSTTKYEPSCKYRLATKSEVRDAMERLAAVLDKMPG